MFLACNNRMRIACSFAQAYMSDLCSYGWPRLQLKEGP
jgi:hypothetical protein